MMFRIVLFFTFIQICFCQCPNGTEASFTNPDNCYIFVANKSEFIIAERYCKQQGGNLASIASAFDNLFLSSEASLYFVDSTDADFWIGATNQLTPGQWSWLDGTPFVYSDWDKGQPENTSSSNCAASSVTSSYWSAQDCFKLKSFACMIPAPSPVTTTTATTTTRLTTTTKRVPTCEYGWHLFETTGFCYHSFESNSGHNWQDAENICVGYNSHLTSIHSQLESDYVADLVRSSYLMAKDDPCKYTQTWIGLYTVNNHQSWIWTDGTPFNFAGWSPGEPNNGNGIENCAQLMLTNCEGDNMDYWNDIRCDRNMKYFVCKKAKS